LERGEWMENKRGGIPNIDLVKKGYYSCKEKENIRIKYIAAHKERLLFL